MIPVLGGNGGNMWLALALAALKIVFVLVLLLYVGQKIMRPWFNLVARQHSSELFMLNLLLITLGIAWLTEQAGLSLALGAFLAGMLVAETEFRYQVEDDIRPFRDLLLGLFFVTVGMTLNSRILVSEWWLVLIFVLILVVGKAAIIAGASRLFGSTPGGAWRTGLTLAQGGEFAFVMLSLADRSHLLPADTMQALIAGIVLSMLVTPFILQHSDKIVLRLARSEWMNLATNLHLIAVRGMQSESHVILCGYGRSGQSVARLLSHEKIPFFALDLDPEKVREAATAGESVVFGDAAKHEVLMAAGLMRARALIISYADTRSSLKILEMVRQIRPELPVIVRTLDDSDIDLLKEAGASEVVAEIMEGSLMLASHTLMLIGTPLNRVLKRIREVRETRYSLFRGFFRGTEDLEDSNRPQPRLHTLPLLPGAAAVGETIASLRLDQLHVELRSVRRQMRQLAADGEFILQAGDVLVLCGESDGLAAAEIRVLQGN
jgi:CPA2 family monovalent cation:H+ antiporter-2